MQIGNWDDLRVFLAVARAGGLARGAEELGVNISTAQRRIDGLERHLGTRLFERHRRGYLLTPAGERLMAALGPVDEGIAAAARELWGRDSGAEGTVRLMLPEGLGVALLAPAMPAFLDAYPGIVLEVADDRALDEPDMRDADLALSPMRPLKGDHLVRHVADMGYGLYAAESYLQRCGRPTAPDALEDHCIAGFAGKARAVAPVWRLGQAGATIRVGADGAALRLAMAESGAALAVLPGILGDGRPGLVRLFGPDRMGTVELWLVARAEIRQLARIRGVMEFLTALIAENAARLQAT